jgi:hypothetical protein
MKKWCLIIIELICSFFAFSQNNNYLTIWPDLKTYYYKHYSVLYNESIFTLVDAPIEERTEDIFKYSRKEIGYFFINKIKFTVIYEFVDRQVNGSYCGLAIESNNKEYTISTFESLCIPVSNTIYTTEYKQPFIFSNKYIFNNSWEKVQQPFYYIGVTTTTSCNVPFYSDIDLINKEGVIAKDSNIQILAISTDENIYDATLLIKSITGLIGYARISNIETAHNMGDKMKYNFRCFDYIVNTP